MMWYHDHAIGITRLNAYAGLAAGYFLIDGDELRMFGSGRRGTPEPDPRDPARAPGQELQEDVADQWGRVGDLDYPSSYGTQEDQVEGLPLWRPLPCRLMRAGVLRGHSGHQRHGLSAAHSAGRRSPLSRSQRHPVAGLEPATLRGESSRIRAIQDVRPASKEPDFIQFGTEGGFLPKPAVVPSGNQFDLDKYSQHDTSRLRPGAGGGRNEPTCSSSSVIARRDRASSCTTTPPRRSRKGTEADYSTGDPAPDSTHGPNTRTLMRIKITNSAEGQKMTDAALLAALEAELGQNQLGLLVDDVTIGSVFDAPLGYTARTRTLNRRLGPVRAPDPDRGDGHPGWCRRHGLRDVLRGRPQRRETRSRADPRSGTSTTRRATRTPSISIW